jgi:hypothetical protein
LYALHFCLQASQLQLELALLFLKTTDLGFSRIELLDNIHQHLLSMEIH